MASKKALTFDAEKAKATARAITIPRLSVVELQVPVTGLSPLICHRFSEKAKRQILDKQMKKAKKAREAKDPEQCFRDSLYIFDDGTRYGIPSLAFKKACVNACRFVDDMKMTFARGAFFIEGEYSKAAGYPLVEITDYDEMVMREDAVRLGGKTADLRYRAEFRGWKAILPVVLFGDFMSPEQFLNLLDIAGQCVGVLEWRPEKGGDFGRFRVERDEV